MYCICMMHVAIQFKNNDKGNHESMSGSSGSKSQFRSNHK